MPLDWCYHHVKIPPTIRAADAACQDQCFPMFWIHLKQAAGLNREFRCLWQEASQNRFLKRIGWTTGLVCFCLPNSILFGQAVNPFGVWLYKCWGQAVGDEKHIPSGSGTLKKDCEMCSIICLGFVILFLLCLRTHKKKLKRKHRCPRLEGPVLWLVHSVPYCP